MFDLVEKMLPRVHGPCADGLINESGRCLGDLRPDTRPHHKPEKREDWRCRLCQREHRRWLKYGAKFKAARSCEKCGFLIAWWLPARRFRLRAGTVSLGERIVVVTFIP